MFRAVAPNEICARRHAGGPHDRARDFLNERAKNHRAVGGTRTPNPQVRSLMLYPLSYDRVRRAAASATASEKPRTDFRRRALTCYGGVRAVGGTRTPNLQVRSLLLYPIELRPHVARTPNGTARTPGSLFAGHTSEREGFEPSIHFDSV